MRTSRRSFTLTALSAALLAACGSSSLDTPASYQASGLTADPQAKAEAQAILRYLASLSMDRRDGVVVGQNMGHGNQVLDTSGLVGYEPLVGALERQTGEAPGMIGLDYEHDRIFTAAELLDANQVLIAHWQRKGLVTVNWSPSSPWLNDETDLANHPGVWTDTRTTGSNMAGVDLRLLLDVNSPMSVIWRRKLDRIAAALLDLQSAGVAVLWRPMQEMNGNWFWWGVSSTPTDPAPFIALWRDMFSYFTDVKGLHNLLWVYSPSASASAGGEAPIRFPVGWVYPGASYVDIVGATSYTETVSIDGYFDLLKFDKVLGMSELGTPSGGIFSRAGSFDDTLYLAQLQKNYPAMAFWQNWHNWSNGDGSFEYQALVSNRNATALMQDPRTLTLGRLQWPGA